MRDPLIVTRFAIRWRDQIPSEEWVAARADMLHGAATIAAAGVPWIWKADPARADQAREIAARTPGRPVVVDAKANTCDEVHPDSARFVTFRVDSDDAYLPGIFAPAAELDLPADTAVLYPAGWQWDTVTGRVARRTYRTFPAPFLAITHDGRDQMLGVGANHTTVHHRYPTVVGSPARSWLQVVHGGNISTRWRPDRTEDDPAPILARFHDP